MTLLQQYMGLSTSTIGQLLPTTALADELKQLSEALLWAGFQGNRRGNALVSFEWVMHQQHGLHAQGVLHLPEPSLLEEQVPRAGLLQLASCTTRPSVPMRSQSSIKVPRDLGS